ncbi:MAG: SusC/RagA family TonB-linked outer membrane protein [Prevotellaceae bacterium]|jgi:TonB-linked SusC/RagA family outer membrane protein|nr:SusC/RagA family TonB-linked outer membrane protein [Prevotellaceae bacterium]
MKKLLPFILCLLCLTNANAQTNSDSIFINNVDTLVIDTTKRSYCCLIACTQVRTREIYPVSDITKTLLGEFAGLRVITENGQTGVASDMILHGINSINAQTRPVFVVDGMIYNGDITAINPADIATVTLFKDINSWLLYGSQAANGVINIVTKKGTWGRQPRFDIDVKFGLNFVPQRHETITDPKTYTELGWQGLYTAAFINGQSSASAANFASGNLFSDYYGVAPQYNPFDTEGRNLINPQTGKFYNNIGYKYMPEKWADYLQRTGKKVETNASLSGGSRYVDYYASFGFLKDEGYYQKSDFQRINALTNLEFKPLRWLDIDLKIAYNNSEFNNPCQNGINNGFGFINGMPPIFPVFEHDLAGAKTDNYDFGDNYNRNFMYGINPVAIINLDKNFQKIDNFDINNLFKIFLYRKELSVNIQNYFNYYTNTETNFANMFYGDAAGIGRISKTTNSYKNFASKQFLKYQKTIYDHEIDVIVGHEITILQNYYSYLSKSMMFNPDDLSLSNFAIINDVQGTTSKISEERIFASAKYNFDEKYFVEANVSFDKNSRFTKGNQLANSWAVGGAWKIDREKFMKNSRNWLETLKLYASYGVIGNGNIALYGNNVIGNDLKPEKSNIFEIGINANIKNRLNIDIDFYDRKNYDLIFAQYIMSPPYWYSIILTNCGSLLNRGIDFQFDYWVVRTRNIYFSVRANVNYNFSKMLSLPAETRYGEEREKIMSGNLAKNHAIDEWYLPEYAGVDAQTGEAVWVMYYDANNPDFDYISNVYQYLHQDAQDGSLLYPNADIRKITTNNYTKAGSNFTGKKASPDVFGGFGFDLVAYGFELCATFAYQIGGYGYDNIYNQLMHDDGFGSYAWHKDMLNAWNPLTENFNTDVPRLTGGLASNAYSANAGSTRFLTSNSALQLANLTIGYNFPREITKKAAMNRLNIFLSCNNLLLASARKGYNPFTFYRENSVMQYLQGASAQVGVKIGF